MGLMLFGGHEGHRPLHPIKESSLPVFKIKGNASFNTEVFLDKTNFSDFAAVTKCGVKQHMIKRNPFAADYIPLHNFKRTHFTNIESDAFAFIAEPNPKWAAVDPLTTPDNCGNWPCTGPENVALKFEQTTYTASSSLNEDTTF
jgi:hypothetical protein